MRRYFENACATKNALTTPDDEIKFDQFLTAKFLDSEAMFHPHRNETECISNHMTCCLRQADGGFQFAHGRIPESKVVGNKSG
jgi:hypothetical protein